MPSSRATRRLFQARLSRRIVLWVFASIVLIEALVLLPSVYRQQQQLLWQLRTIAAAKATGALGNPDPTLSDAALLARVEQAVLSDQKALGGALYRADGQLVGQFGEAPDLSVAAVQLNTAADRFDWDRSHYDAAWLLPPLLGRYWLIVRLNAAWVKQELVAFVWRIAILVMIISIFVTVVTTLGLERLVIMPILRLRRDLLRAGAAVQGEGVAPAFESQRSGKRNDELGDVISAFHQMYGQVQAAIAERQQAESALRQSEERFSKAFRASPTALLISTLQEGRLLEVNDSFLALYGATASEVLGQNTQMLNLWGEAEHRQQMVAQLHKTGAIRNQEYTFRRRSGEPRVILFSAELIQINGEDCIVSIANDITERKQAEKAMTRLAEIGELAAMIVHEVRNPLTTVLMGLKSFQQIDLPPRAQLRLTLALEEADRLQRLLNEILNFSRCQKLQDATELDLNLWLPKWLDRLRQMPVAQSRQLIFVPAAAPAWVIGDRDKLQQVVINLVTNACEASPANGEVTCQLKLELDGVALQIGNTGDRIPAEILAQLGKPFFTTKPNGNGLGLAIVRRIVEAHGGELRLESAPATGTIVTVLLPRSTFKR